jgi:hypothetical protein
VWHTLGNDRRLYFYSQTEYGKKRYCGDDTAGWTECKYDHREHECVIFSGITSTTSGSAGRIGFPQPQAMKVVTATDRSLKSWP